MYLLNRGSNLVHLVILALFYSLKVVGNCRKEIVGKCRSGKLSGGKTSGWGFVAVRNCPGGKMSGWEIVMWDVVRWEIVEWEIVGESLFIIDIVVDSFKSISRFACSLSWIHLIPNQLRFTESKKDFLLDLLFLLKVESWKRIIYYYSNKCNQREAFLILCHTTITYELLLPCMPAFTMLFIMNNCLLFYAMKWF